MQSLENNYNKRSLGSRKEKLAADYLAKQGLSIIEMNYRCRIGEIDIVARQNTVLVFVEVKYRRNKSAGMPEEAVNHAKCRTICRVADFYRIYKKIPENSQIRFDVVAIEGENIRWYRNAFSYC